MPLETNNVNKNIDYFYKLLATLSGSFVDLQRLRKKSGGS
jgi:hypothetical protein